MMMMNQKSNNYFTNIAYLKEMSMTHHITWQCVLASVNQLAVQSTTSTTVLLLLLSLVITPACNDM